MNFDSPLALQYHIYNSLFLSLPFSGIEHTGTRLALFAQACAAGFAAGQRPDEIIHEFWEEHLEKAGSDERLDLLFHFIQYVERQVVLFDSVEDALFADLHSLDGPGSLTHLFTRLDSPAQREKLLEKIRSFGLRLVLTAHPTQFYPGKVLAIINDLGREIERHDIGQIRLLLMQLGKTAFVNKQRPTPLDEAISLGWYLENVFYEAMPDILFRLLRVLDQDVTTFENPHLLTLGFWPGGDRDGNPYVTADITLEVARLLREGVLRGYYRDIRLLRRRLTFQGVEKMIIRAEQRIYHTLYYPDREGYETCQELLTDLLEARRILVAKHEALFLDQLDRFILKVRVFGFYFASLDIRQDSRKHGEVWTKILQNEPDGAMAARYAALDEAAKIEFLLTNRFHLDENDSFDPLVKETIRSFRAIPKIQAQNGERGCHRYVISNCKSALNVMEVLALAPPYPPIRGGERTLDWESVETPRPALNTPSPLGGGLGRGPSPPLMGGLGGANAVDIVPLFETIDDLAACAEVMEQLFTNSFYSRHLAGRGNVQTIMLGFSDGTKDGGYLRANWSIYRAKEELTAVSRRHGVEVIFFDGRGGPPARGGGNNAAYYSAQGPTIANYAIQVTIQGQTVSSTYGTAAAARFNIERLLTAGLENTLLSPDPDFSSFGSSADKPAEGTKAEGSGIRGGLSSEDRALLEELAEAAYQAYLDLKNHPDFVPYLEQVTPLKWYGDTNIASRPTQRFDVLPAEGTKAGDPSEGTKTNEPPIRFEDLRAIPFVGAWAQMKQNVPGYYGVGAALERLREKGKSEDLRQLFQHSLFFRTLLDNSMQSLHKTSFNVTRHLAEHPQFGDFWEILRAESERTKAALLAVSGQTELPANNPKTLVSIQLREKIVLPLIAIQQYALQKLQEKNLPDEEVATYRKMVLRAMFGIINAARNAA